MLDENDSTTTDTSTEDTSETDSPDTGSPQSGSPESGSPENGTSADPQAPVGDSGPVLDPAAPPAPAAEESPAPAKKVARKSTRRPAKKATAVEVDPFSPVPDEQPTPDPAAPQAEPAAKTTAKKSAVKKTTAKKAAKKTTAKRAAKKSAVPDAASADAPLPTSDDALLPGSDDAPESDLTPTDPVIGTEPGATTSGAEGGADAEHGAAAPSVLFQAPDPAAAKTPRRRRSGAKRSQPGPDDASADQLTADQATPDQGDAQSSGVPDEPADRAGAAGPDGTAAEPESAGSDAQDAHDDPDDAQDQEAGEGSGGNRRRRRRGGRRRRKSSGEDSEATDDEGQDGSAQGSSDADTTSSQKRVGQNDAPTSGSSGGSANGGDTADESAGESSGDGTASRRRRRRRRTGEDGDNAAGSGSEEPQTVTRVRKPRNAEDEITSLHGSTRLEAKKQRRREGREAGRRRAPIVSEAEFLARREAVDRVMVIRQQEDLTQIAVIEDKVLVEHYVARESQTSLIGNVYLGRVQNVLPSMEAAFVDIGKGRNAVLYAGEVNWDALGAGNGPRKIEQVLKSGQPILVQVSKDPIGHKGARLTAQVSLPGRFLVYVPDGTTSGISRKLPDNERSRLKSLLKEMVPDSAGVIVRTAAEGASEEELTFDVERLTSRWADIESKVGKGNAPQLLYGEPDLTLKVVRDLFTEDFARLVVSGDAAWDMVEDYVQQIAPDLEERLERHTGNEDVFAHFRIDEQIAKGLDNKVWLPSGGSLIIDRTEAMTVVDVNTGKFTGSGGNLEETVTKNNLEAAEEMVRQLRLRDIGGIIVVDFIDMVLESNRDLVLRRLVECLGRDRTRHQVAEVTSLGLVQMTRKRIGTGLLEAFSETCQHCQGRGLVIHHEPVEAKKQQDDEPRRGRRGRNRGDNENGNANGAVAPLAVRAPSPADLAAMAKHEPRPVEESVDEPGSPAGSVKISIDTGEQPAPESAPEIVDPEPTDEAGTAPVEAEVLPAAESMPVVVDLAQDQPTDQPVDEATDQPVDEPTDQPVDEATDQPVDQPTEQPVDQAIEQPAPPSVPVAPRVVTSSRRRVARRPAGPPPGAATEPADGRSEDSA